MKNSNDTIWDRTSDLQIFSTEPQPLSYRGPPNLKVVKQNADIFFSFFNQIWILLTGFHKIPQYQILLKSVLWEPCWYMGVDELADRHEGANRLFSRKRLRTAVWEAQL